jgi:eukaryotic-like serine/threonine-protein kinase
MSAQLRLHGARVTCVGFLLAVLTSVMLPGGAIASAGTAMPTQWTKFRLNAQNNPVIDLDAAPSWTVETHGAISASPSVVDGVLYLGNNAGALYAIDVTSGRVRWTYQVKNPFMSDPLVYKGVVIVGEGNANSTTYVPRREVEVGNGPNALIGLDVTTGKRRWRVPLSGSAMPTPTIVGGLLVEHNGDGGLIGLDPSTGRVAYRTVVKSVGSMVGLLPAGAGLVVTAGIFPNRVFAFHASDGRIAWNYWLSSHDSGVGDCPPASDGRRVFGDYLAPASANLDSGFGVQGVERVYALDAQSGQPHWNIALESGTVPPRNETAIPLVVGNRLYVGSAIAPFIHAIDTATGNVVWRVKVAGAVLGGIVAAKNRLYFGDLSGTLWAVDARSGTVVGSLRTRTPYDVGSPIIVGGSLIIGSDTGSIAAIPLSHITEAH